MLKRVKKLYSHSHKTSKSDNKTPDIFDNYKNIGNCNKIDKNKENVRYEDDTLDENTPPQPLPLRQPKTLRTSETPEITKSTPHKKPEVSFQIDEKNKRLIRLRKHLFKKNKSVTNNETTYKKFRKSSAPDIERTKSLSKSTGDLSSRRHSTPASLPQSETAVKRMKKNSGTSSQNSVSSLESLRENRRSVICKLDEYIKHVRRSIDDGNITSAPNRLCCAELLRTVYLRREQQCHYESLKNRQRSNRNSDFKDFKMNNSNPDIRLRSPAARAESRSLQDLKAASLDSCQIGWQRRDHYVSGSSSMDSTWSGGNGKSCDRLSNSVYTDVERRNNDELNSTFDDEIDSKYNASCDADMDIEPDNEYNNKSYSDCHSQYSKLNNRRKSIPLFPQAIDIDIY